MLYAILAGLCGGVVSGGATSLKVFAPKSGVVHWLFRIAVPTFLAPFGGMVTATWLVMHSGELDALNLATALVLTCAVWIASLYRYLFKPIYADPAQQQKPKIVPTA
jgi:hypothetical protein